MYGKETDRQERWRVSTFLCLQAKEEIREYERSRHRKKAREMREMRIGKREDRTINKWRYYWVRPKEPMTRTTASS